MKTKGESADGGGASRKRRRSGTGGGGVNTSATGGGKRRKKRQQQRRQFSKEHKDSILRDAKLEAKKDFEEMRDNVLKQIPEKVKNMFGQMGFSKWGKYYLPCLILSPYSVPEDPVRRQWFDMFEKVKKNSRIEHMTYLVYWYGTKDVSLCYSFIPQQRFKSYEWGVQNGHDELPQPVIRKMEKNRGLTEVESGLVLGLQEMREDVDKDPSERKRGVIDFCEGYDMLTQEDVEGVLKANKYDPDLLDYEEDDHEDDDDDGDGDDDDNDEEDSEEDELETGEPPSPPPPPPPPPKRAKAKKSLMRKRELKKKDSGLAEDNGGVGGGEGGKAKEATPGPEPAGEEESVPAPKPTTSKKGASKKGRSSQTKKKAPPSTKKETAEDAGAKGGSTGKKQRKGSRKSNRGKAADTGESETAEKDDAGKVTETTAQAEDSAGDADVAVAPDEKKPPADKDDDDRQDGKEKKAKGEKEKRLRDDKENQRKDDKEKKQKDKEKKQREEKDKRARDDNETQKDDKNSKGKKSSVADDSKKEEPQLKKRKKASEHESESTSERSDAPPSSKKRREKETGGNEAQNGEDDKEAPTVERGDKQGEDDSRYHSIIDGWKAAVEAEDVDALQDRLSEASAVVEEFSVAFMREQLPSLIKRTRALQKEIPMQFDLKELKRRIQAVYDEKIRKQKEAKTRRQGGGKIEGGRKQNLPLKKGKQGTKEKKNTDSSEGQEGDSEESPKEGKHKKTSPKKGAKKEEGDGAAMDKDGDSIEGKQDKPILAARTANDDPGKGAKSKEVPTKKEDAEQPPHTESSAATAPSPPGKRDTQESGSLAGAPRKAGGEEGKPKREVKPPMGGGARDKPPAAGSGGQARPERKKFSLSSFMAPSTKEVPGDTRSRRPPVVGKRKAAPSWITGSVSVESPRDRDRAFALDFLREMASHFPAGKVNAESVALSIEAAIFAWASSGGVGSKGASKVGKETGKEAWLDAYWTKVHAIVASVCGKRDPGTLMHLISSGAVAEPKELVLLPQDKLTDSFEGRAVIL